nr:hypothetical protein [Brevibacillus sp. Leaf182]
MSDVDFHYCQIQINKGKGSKDRIVPFPHLFSYLMGCRGHFLRTVIHQNEVQTTFSKKY